MIRDESQTRHPGAHFNSMRQNRQNSPTPRVARRGALENEYKNNARGHQPKLICMISIFISNGHALCVWAWLDNDHFECEFGVKPLTWLLRTSSSAIPHHISLCTGQRTCRRPSLTARRILLAFIFISNGHALCKWAWLDNAHFV